MLDFCAARKIVPDIEMIAMADIENAYARWLRGDVRYRFVIDMHTLAANGIACSCGHAHAKVTRGVPAPLVFGLGPRFSVIGDVRAKPRASAGCWKRYVR